VYTGDIKESFSFYDLAGNEGTGEVSITWIDKTPVIGNIAYGVTGATNSDVLATISFNKPNEKIIILNNNG
jgi:hypothetical protein